MGFPFSGAVATNGSGIPLANAATVGSFLMYLSATIHFSRKCLGRSALLRPLVVVGIVGWDG